MNSEGGGLVFLLVTLLSGLGCGEGSESTPDAGPLMAPECADLSGCGAGMPNHLLVSFCEHCFARPDTHVCEAGSCRELTVPLGGKLSFSIVVPVSARGAESWTQVSLNPLRADGGWVTCQSALVSTDYQGNGQYNAGNSNFKNFATAGGADPLLAYPSSIAADVGSDRLLIIRVTSKNQGKGRVMAQGCVEGIEVKANETTNVEVILNAP